MTHSLRTSRLISHTVAPFENPESGRQRLGATATTSATRVGQARLSCLRAHCGALVTRAPQLHAMFREWVLRTTLSHIGYPVRTTQFLVQATLQMHKRRDP